MRSIGSCFTSARSCRRSHSTLLPRGCNLRALFLSIYVEWDERSVDLLGTPSVGTQGSGTIFSSDRRGREGFFLSPRDCHRCFQFPGERSRWKSQRPSLHWLFVSFSVFVHPPIFQEKKKGANLFFKSPKNRKEKRATQCVDFCFFSCLSTYPKNETNTTKNKKNHLSGHFREKVGPLSLFFCSSPPSIRRRRRVNPPPQTRFYHCG